MPPTTPVPDIIDFFKRQGKTVLTLAGFSGSGYEHLERVAEAVTGILARHDPATTLVNLGATTDGIGEAYRWAKERGFTTSGIVSTGVLQFDVTLSPDCDFPFVVEDPSIGGCVHGRLSPVSEAMVSVSDVMIAIGGGDVARDELSEMEKRGKPCHFIEADMNHSRARARARAQGRPLPEPYELKGSVYARFRHE